MNKQRIRIFNPKGYNGEQPLKSIYRVVQGIVGFNKGKYSAFQKVRYKNKAFSIHHSNKYGLFIRLDTEEFNL